MLPLGHTFVSLPSSRPKCCCCCLLQNPWIWPIWDWTVQSPPRLETAGSSVRYCTQCFWQRIWKRDSHTPLAETLAVSDNQLSGTLPTEFGQLQHMGAFFCVPQKRVLNHPSHMSLFLFSSEYLYIIKTQVNGPIPEEFGQMGASIHLRLQKNQLTGTVPNILARLSDLGKDTFVVWTRTQDMLNQPCYRNVGCFWQQSQGFHAIGTLYQGTNQLYQETLLGLHRWCVGVQGTRLLYRLRPVKKEEKQ